MFLKVLDKLVHTQVNIWRKVIDTSLLSHLFASSEVKKRSSNSKIIVIIWIFLTIALSGPAWQKTPQAMYKNLVPTMIIIDTSNSMNATDVEPSRIFRSVLKAYDLVEEHKGALFSLIAFTSEPYVIVPLSDDENVIKTYLPLLSNKVMPSDGSRLDRAIELAMEELLKGGIKAGHIVVFTDTASHYQDDDRAISAASVAARNGYVVSVFGVGTEEGGEIKIGKYKTTSTAIDEQSLIKLVTAGKGRYHKLVNDDADIKYIFANMDKRIRELNPLVKADIDSVMWQDEGIYFLLPVLILFPFLFRKGTIVVLVISVSLFVSGSAFALDIRELFLSPEQYGKLLIKEKKFSQSEPYFVTNNHLFVASLVYGKQEEKLKAFLSQVDDFNSLYSAGTMLAKQENYELSLKFLEKAVKLNSESEDATINYNIVKKILEKQQPPPPPQDGGENPKKKDKENPENGNEAQQQNQSQETQPQQKQEIEKKLENQQQINTGDIEEPAEDIIFLLRNKLLRIYNLRRYGSGGEEVKW